jgi:hypothetical protein
MLSLKLILVFSEKIREVVKEHRIKNNVLRTAPEMTKVLKFGTISSG